MKLKLSLLGLLLLAVFSVKAQDKNGEKPTFVGKAISMKKLPSLESRKGELILAENLNEEAKDGRSSKNNIIPGKDPQTEDDYFVSNPNRLAGKIAGKAPTLVFDAAESNSQPTDPSIAIGPNHAFVIFNTGFIIYDKSGNPLTAQLDDSNIFSNGDTCCDLTASYDKAANRWVLTILSSTSAGNSGDFIQVAVSDGPDPVTSSWNSYLFNMNTDYQKLSIWSDGYYLTANKNSGSAGTSEVVYAFERDVMLAGGTDPQIIGFPLPGISTNGFYSPQAINVTDDNLPAAGSAPIVYLQDDAWSGVSQDHIKVWSVDVDWDTPGNSTISQPNELITTPFISVFDNGSFSNLSQPGGGAIDALQATIMNQAQFRKFSGHNSAVFDFVVDTDASGGKLAGVRWFELRQSGDGQPWSIYQEGTYTSPDGKHAWHASMMMDLQGNIGMGYTAMAGPDTPNPSDFRVSSYYTGRFASDPLNTMTISEELVAAGNGNIPSNRYGDYSKIDIDPTNDKEFWFINEYINSGRKDVVGVFQIAPNFNDDVGVVSIDEPVTGTLSASEDVTVTIFNFGQNSASNFDVTYQVDGGALVTETFAGPLASATSAQYTFTATADLSTVGETYSITAATDYGADEDNTNDSATKEVTYLEPNDIGVTAITSPNSGENLTASETVTVTINNFGGEPQSNFDVSYEVNGNIVTETVAGPLAGDSQTSYTFNQDADLSAFGTYNFTATTSLAGDSDTSNDATSKVVVNSNCQPESNCNAGDGIRLFQLGDIDNSSGCDPNGYGDYTNLTTDLEIDTTYDLTITTEYGSQYVRVWIDFNDDFVFTLDELVVDNYQIAPGSGGGTYTETMDLVIPDGVTLGQHLMRAKTNWNGPVPDDACQETTYGETEDYMANIFDPLSTNDPFSEAQFTIVNTGNNNFDVSLKTQSVAGKLELSVYNVLGQRLVYRVLENEGEGYNYNLNMSYVKSGVYLVKIGNSEIGKVQRIIVE